MGCSSSIEQSPSKLVQDKKLQAASTGNEVGHASYTLYMLLPTGHLHSFTLYMLLPTEHCI